LTDYGLALVNSNPKFTATTPATGKLRWLAPEIIDPPPDQTSPAAQSKPADIFAFGMLAIGVITGKYPFEGCSDLNAARQISEGIRPERPQDAQDVGLTPKMWGLLEGCWSQDPARRPTIEEVVRACENFLEIDKCTQRISSDLKRGDVSDDRPGEPQPTGTGGQTPRLSKQFLSFLDRPLINVMCDDV